MPNVEHSVLINANIDKVFSVTNDLARWPELFGGEYTAVRILEEDKGIVRFQLTNNEGHSWVSIRYIDKENYKVRAERLDPKFPFKFMNIFWNYQTENEGTRMTWIQEFEVDESLMDKEEKFLNFITEHTKENQLRIKEIIEGES